MSEPTSREAQAARTLVNDWAGASLRLADSMLDLDRRIAVALAARGGGGGMSETSAKRTGSKGADGSGGGRAVAPPTPPRLPTATVASFDADPARAIARMLGKLDDADKETFNRLIGQAKRAELLALRTADERRRCAEGHEQDRLWSTCRVCQYGQEIDALRAAGDALAKAVEDTMATVTLPIMRLQPLVVTARAWRTARGEG